MSNIDSIKNELDRAYAKYDRIMADMPDYMTVISRSRHIALAHAQRGRIEGLELALSLVEEAA